MAVFLKKQRAEAAFGGFRWIDLEKLHEIKKKMHPKRTMERKLMAFQSFEH